MAGRPILAVVNKVDRVRPTERLLPFLAELARRAQLRRMVPVSALRATISIGCSNVHRRSCRWRPPLFRPEQITDRSERFLIAEIIREKLTLELSAGTALRHRRWKSRHVEADARRRVSIAAVIWVEREGQKAIVIGEKGERLKDIGRAARAEAQRHAGHAVLIWNSG